MYPSTCGLMFDACRDFTTDKYSVVSGIFRDFATITCTGIAGGAFPPAPPADVFWHPAAHTTPITAAARATQATDPSPVRVRSMRIKAGTLRHSNFKCYDSAAGGQTDKYRLTC